MAERLQAKHKGSVLASRKIEYAPDDDAVELCYQRGWSDSLPVTPPTDVRVLRMLAGTSRKADEMIPKFHDDGLLVVRAGGPAGLFSGILPGWLAGSCRRRS